MADVEALAATMREGDAAECAAWGYTPRQALEMGLKGLACFATTFDGEVGAMWGCCTGAAWPGASHLGGARCVWLLTGEAVERHPRAFYEESKRVVATVTALWGRVGNAVDVRYVRALRWLRALGGRLGPTVDVRGHLFLVVTFGG